MCIWTSEQCFHFDHSCNVPDCIINICTKIIYYYCKRRVYFNVFARTLKFTNKSPSMNTANDPAGVNTCLYLDFSLASLHFSPGYWSRIWKLELKSGMDFNMIIIGEWKIYSPMISEIKVHTGFHFKLTSWARIILCISKFKCLQLILLNYIHDMLI